jgi:cyanate permease
MAGIMLAGGYLIASAGPLLLGVARDLSGGFGPALAVLGVLSVALVVVTLILSPERLARRPRLVAAEAVSDP